MSPNGENILPLLEGESSCLDKVGFIRMLPTVSQTSVSATVGFTLNLSVFT